MPSYAPPLCLLAVTAGILGFQYPGAYAQAAAETSEASVPDCRERSGQGCVCITRARATDLLAQRKADKEVPGALCPPHTTPAGIGAAAGSLLTALAWWLL